MVRLREGAIPVFLVRGNHDAANKMTKDLKLVDNVRIFATDRAETVVLEDQGVALHGQSFPTQAVVTNLARSYPPRSKGCFNIGLLHTCVDGREGHERYAPCTLADLQAREYGYWALGHIHAREILQQGDPWIVFPGNLQGRHARETGPKGCILVTVDDAQNTVSAEPRWLDVVRWETCQLDAKGARDGHEVVDRFRSRLLAILPEAEDRLLALRVEIKGSCLAHSSLASHAAYWTGEFRQAALDTSSCRVWVEKILLQTCPVQNVSDDFAGDSPLAELMALLSELKESDEQLGVLCTRALGDLVRRLPPELLDGINSRDRLRATLSQLEPLLLERLQVT
jgi:DNA repair exonuclease SbcCD nuclease subunit